MSEALRGSKRTSLCRLWVLTLILPHSIAANLAWPDEVYAQGWSAILHARGCIQALSCTACVENSAPVGSTAELMIAWVCR